MENVKGVAGLRRLGECLLILVLTSGSWLLASPPMAGTIFMDPDIIDGDDPSLFVDSLSIGEGERLVFDRRVNAWQNQRVYLFAARFLSGQVLEARVNQEFGSVEAARERVDYYAEVIGRIPLELMRDVSTITIHSGIEPFGGGSGDLLIHDGQGGLYEADGILEEVFVHEAAHISLDSKHAAQEAWVAAQQADPDFISDYASDFPAREDIAESFSAYLAVTFRRDRVEADLVNTIKSAIPARLAYFESQEMLLYPMASLAEAPRLQIRPAGDGLELVKPYSQFELFSLDEGDRIGDWRESPLEWELGLGVYRIRLGSGEIGQESIFYRLREKL